MNTTDYIDYLRRTRKRKSMRRLKLFLTSLLAAILIICGSLYVVKNASRFDLPDLAASYLLNTLFYEFSPTELKNIIHHETGSDKKFYTLLFTYTIYHVANLYAILLSVWFTIRGRMILHRIRLSYKNGLLVVSDLRKGIEDYVVDPTSIKRLLLTLKIRFLWPSFRISPLPYRWYEKRMYQWLESSSLTKKTRSIVHTLNRFDDALIKAIHCSYRLADFRKALENLEIFFFSIALRSDEYLKNHPGKPSLAESETDILYSFSVCSRPLMIGVEKIRVEKRHRIGILIGKLFSQSVVRYGFLVAVVAGAVMIIGVFLFKLDPSQAFLTWFTVAFGSMTLSVGISSISIARGKEDDLDAKDQK